MPKHQHSIKQKGKKQKQKLDLSGKSAQKTAVGKKRKKEEQGLRKHELNRYKKNRIKGRNERKL